MQWRKKDPQPINASGASMNLGDLWKQEKKKGKKLSNRENVITRPTYLQDFCKQRKNKKKVYFLFPLLHCLSTIKHALQCFFLELFSIVFLLKNKTSTTTPSPTRKLFSGDYLMLNSHPIPLWAHNTSHNLLFPPYTTPTHSHRITIKPHIHVGLLFVSTTKTFHYLH